MTEDPADEGKPILRVEGLEYETRGFRLGPLTLHVSEGRVLSIVGPNGAGKTTLLRLISGLETPVSGRILLRDRDLTHVLPHRRNVGLVFQDHALFPHMTVEQNVAYGMRVRGEGPAAVDGRVREILKEFRLARYAARLPRELSGGERQRLAIARALAPDPGILLLDEPLNSIDPEQRRYFQAELKTMLAAHHVTAIHVTHDLDEGAYLSDRMAVMMAGKIVEDGETGDVLGHPRTPDVARFLGYNVWLEEGRWVACRPSALVVEPSNTASSRQGVVVSTGRTLAGLTIVVRLPGEERVRVDVDRPAPAVAALKPGDPVRLAVSGLVELGR